MVFQLTSRFLSNLLLNKWFFKTVCHQVDVQNKAGEVVGIVNSWDDKETSEWRRRVFNPHYTDDYDFHFLNGESIPVPFVTSYMKNRFVSVFDGFKVLGFFINKDTIFKLTVLFHVHIPPRCKRWAATLL